MLTFFIGFVALVAAGYTDNGRWATLWYSIVAACIIYDFIA